MESDNNVISSFKLKMDIEGKIKKEPDEILTRVKSERGDFETVLVSPHFVRECDSGSEIDNSAVCNKIEIKEEPCWPENRSDVIKEEVELFSATVADVQNDIKQTASQEHDAEQVSRFCKESMWTHSADSGGNSDCNITLAPPLPICSQQHITEANYTLNSDGKGSLDQNHRICGKKMQCDECDKKFIKATALKNHKLIHAGKRPYTCDVCNKSFIYISNLKMHKLIHEGKRPHACEVCKKSFTQASALKKHKLIHEGKRPHKCEICDKSFTDTSHLKSHKLIHEGKKPHSCDICNKSFTESSNLRKHKLIHEGKRPHACDICDKSFTDTSHLKSHKLIHEGKRPYICDICNKGFNQASTLKNHKLIHEGKRPHTCEICNKSFTLPVTLKKHKLTHGRNRPQL